MSLALSLNNALSGLNINQQALSVLSQNIANVNTPGFSKKTLQLSAQYLDGNGAGVRLDDIIRRVDKYLISTTRTQASVVARATVTSDYADRTQLMLGNVGSNNSVNAYLSTFFNALQTLSQTPEDASLKSGVLQRANTLTQQLAQLGNNLHGLRYQADQDISEAISIINSDLVKISDVNKIITQNLVLGKPVTELLDRRDQYLNELAQYMDIQTFERESGAINVSVNGVSLLDDRVYQLQYTPVNTPSALVNDAPLSAILVYGTDVDGNLVGNPTRLTTAGISSTVASVITSGKIKGLLDVRDRQVPQLLAQLDMLAYTLRDQVNAIHNAGSGFPGAYSYTGSHAVSGQDASDWTGQVRIAVLDQNGQPVPSGYSNQTYGIPPLTLDLSTLNSGLGAGHPTVQAIINEINQYYGAPQNKVSLGPLTNIRLASGNTSLPNSQAEFNFDLDLENLSNLGANVFVTDVQVLNDASADITSVTSNVPSIAIDATNGFATTLGSGTITITTDGTHEFAEGDTVFLPDITTAILPATDLNGIDLSLLNDQYFTISNVTSNSFQITVTGDTASSAGSVASTGATILPPYAAVDAGETRRTTDDGVLTVDLTGQTGSAYYTVNLTVGVVDENGNINTSVLSYRVDNNQSKLLNDRYAVRSVSGQANLIPPGTTQSAMRAILVDADGNELPKSNGEYISSETGYLKLIAGNSSYVISIDSLDSVELGDSTGATPRDATNRGFSYYFGLNNFFTDSDSDDPITNSALNLAVEQRLIDDPNLLSTGTLTQTPPTQSQAVTFTYERTVGNQEIITLLANLGLSNVAFDSAGGLGNVSQTFTGYAAQIVGAAAINANSQKEGKENAELLKNGFDERSSAVSGVNLDEEVANTIIYQNAYSASARVITVTKELFDALIQAT